MRSHFLRFLIASFGAALAAGCSPSDGPRMAELRERLGRIEDGRRVALASGGSQGGQDPLRLSDMTGEGGASSAAPADGAPTEAAPAEGSPSSSTAYGTAASGNPMSDEDKATLYARRDVLPSFGQTVKRDVKTMAPDLWRDTKRVYGNPVNLAILGVSYGGALAVQETGPNRSVEDHYDHHHTFSKDWRDAFGAMGNPGTHFAVAGVMYAVGQQMQDEKTYQVSKALFSALIINGVSTMVGQAATSDRAPNGEWGTFPSGHTSSTFCFATVMNEAYGPFVGVPLYGLGTLVAIERLDDHEHYFADVLYGGVLGIVVGHAVASGRDPEFFGWKILPYVDPQGGGSGVAVMKSWK